MMKSTGLLHSTSCKRSIMLCVMIVIAVTMIGCSTLSISEHLEAHPISRVNDPAKLTMLKESSHRIRFDLLIGVIIPFIASSSNSNDSALLELSTYSAPMPCPLVKTVSGEILTPETGLASCRYNAFISESKTYRLIWNDDSSEIDIGFKRTKTKWNYCLFQTR